MWYTYIVQCSDNTLYTGVTTDVQRRIRQHNGELVWGAKYTRVRQPVELVYQAEFQNRSEASREEYRIKQLSKDEKKNLIC